MSIYGCVFRALVWILIGLIIDTGTISFKDQKHLIACYNKTLSPACEKNISIAITSFRYGFKPATLMCQVDGTANGSCCVYNETTDCLQENATESRYVDAFSGRSEGVLSSSSIIAEPGGGCDRDYTPSSLLSIMDYACIPASEVASMCKEVTMINVTTVYLNNLNYPDGIPNDQTYCTCSVQSRTSGTLQIYTLHSDLQCEQSLIVTDIDGEVLKNVSCKTLSLNKITNETFETSYITIKLNNSYKNTNAGKFWFGFSATTDITPGPSVSLHCPAVYPDCGPPQNISDGSVNFTKTVYGGNATYICNEGYRLTSGNGVLVCGADSSWRGSFPICSRINCSEPTDIDNGNVTYTSTVYGSTVTYVCHRGHNMTNGNPTRICTADGKWNGSAPICLPVDCGPPPNVNYTKVSYSGTVYGDSATYTCIADYNMASGNLVLMCSEEGLWEGTTPTCSKINCSEPEDIENGNVTYSSLTLGSSVTYVCDEGYVMTDGNPTRTCSADGTWNGTKPICSHINCSMPDGILNGRVTLSSTVNGFIVTYVCDEGHVITDGNQTRTCLTNGTWGGIAPTCSPVYCGPLNKPANGEVNAPPSWTFAMTATFSCNTNYRLEGSDVIRCLASGHWSHPSPNCVEEKGLNLLMIILILVACVFGIVFVVGIGICVCRRRHSGRNSVPWQERPVVNQKMKIPRASTHNSSNSNSSSCNGADSYMEIKYVNSHCPSGFHPDCRRSSKSFDLPRENII